MWIAIILYLMCINPHFYNTCSEINKVLFKPKPIGTEIANFLCMMILRNALPQKL